MFSILTCTAVSHLILSMHGNSWTSLPYYMITMQTYLSECFSSNSLKLLMHKAWCVEANIYNGNLQFCGSEQRPSERNEIKEGEINGDCTARAETPRETKLQKYCLGRERKLRYVYAYSHYEQNYQDNSEKGIKFVLLFTYVLVSDKRQIG